MIKLFINIILLFTAWILKLVLFPCGISLTFILFILSPFTFFKNLAAWTLQIAVGIDKLGNVVLQYPLNKWFITEYGYKFGNYSDTISYVLGKNKMSNNLKPLGVFLCSVLNKIDKNHVEKAVLVKE
jgi:hypothetical protein